jgi:iron complex outermembrane receptor protein
MIALSQETPDAGIQDPSREEETSMEEKKKRRTKGLRYWLALPLVVLCLSSAGAADTVPLGEVVVTATRYGEQSAVVPANVTVISNEDIQTSSARNIPDLLTTEAGIHVSDITGNKRSFTVDLRGFGEAASAPTIPNSRRFQV